MKTLHNLQNGNMKTQTAVFIAIFTLVVTAFIILQLTGVIHFKCN